MAEKKLLEPAKRKKVTFSFQNESAKSVHVSGDFCGWDIDSYPMKKKKGENIWTAQVVLPKGQYEYKFLVDDQWANDPTNNQVRENSFGTYNNVLDVGSK